MKEDEKQRIVEAIQKKYGEEYRNFKWISDKEAEAAEAERSSIIDSVKENLFFGYNGTKPYYMDISPGCKHCGEGTWSCLFINGKCNGRCFFCPSEQTETGEPVTNALQFTSPHDYLDYLSAFGIKGVSISGGEPLLTIDRSTRFLSAVQRRFEDKIHKWLYTNGILLAEENLEKLREAGLNEIRLNLYAQNYNIEKIKLAARYIPTVTVEIPAIPEDYERLCSILPELIENGVRFLNLHQLRCTPYNYKKFIARRYTFLHGQDALVLESELTALRLIKYTIESKLDLPVNYCSFVYRNNFQKIRARQRSAPCLLKPYEELTYTGMIRSLSVKLTREEVDRIALRMKENGETESSVYYETKSMKFSFTGSGIKYIDKQLPVTLSYFDSALNSSPSYRNVFKEIRLNAKKKITAERWRALPDIELEGEELFIFRDKYLDKTHSNPTLPDSDKWVRINSMELPCEGLQSYW
jgi:pyruvate formate-lyase activating enzyme-like uncharacterized protein